MLSQQYRVSYAKLQISVVKAQATLIGLLIFPHICCPRASSLVVCLVRRLEQRTGLES